MSAHSSSQGGWQGSGAEVDYRRRRRLRWVALAIVATVIGSTECLLIYWGRRAAGPPPAGRTGAEGMPAAAAGNRRPVANQAPHPPAGPQRPGRLPDPDAPVTTPAALIEEAKQLAAWMTTHFRGDPDAYEIMARVHYWLGDSKSAIHYWRKCLDLDPNYIHACFGMGVVAADKGDYQEAARWFRKALALAPMASEPRMQLASALINLGQMQEAAALLEEEKQVTWQSPAGLRMLGLARLKLKQYDKAKEAYEAAIQLEPTEASAYYGAARACEQLGHKEQARQYMARFRKLRDSERKFYQDQRRGYDDLESTRSELAKLCTTAGKVCWGQGKPEEAERLWKRALRLDPAAAGCREALAGLYLETGRHQQAAALLEELRKQHPNNVGYLLQLGQLHGQAGRLEQAEKAFQEVCKMAPQFAGGYVALAQLYLDHDWKLSQATALAWKAIELEPSAANYWLLGRACEKNGDRVGAAAAVGQAVELAPDNVQFREKYKALVQSQ